MIARLKGFIFFLSFFLLLMVPKQSFSWGRNGHKIIIEIAFTYLSDQTKNNILYYLNGMSPEDASCWMDEVRGDNAYDYMKPYHYADFEKGEPATNLTGDNIIGVLNSTLKSLEDSKQLSNEQIKTELLYLLHLIGDIHQPLHVGYPDDKGGNTYQISFMGNGSNLHKVWDTEIIGYKNMSLQDVLSANKLSRQQIATIQKIDIVSWANESRGYLDKVYSIQGHKVDEQYIGSVYPIIEKQLMYAGLRLAAVLEKYFGYINRQSKTSAIAKTFTKVSSTTINPEDAANHVGETLTVCGKVFGGRYLKNSGSSLTLINMGAEYPNNPFTLVIYGSDRSNFSYVPEEFLAGKIICVTGLLKLYKGKPEVIVSRESEIQIK
jgi:S1/P1 Nuclease